MLLIQLHFITCFMQTMSNTESTRYVILVSDVQTCDAIHYRVYAHMHWAYFWATVLWNLCQTSMQPDSKQRKRYLRPGTFNSTEGLPQRLQAGSAACVKSQRLVGQPRAVLCLWVTHMGSEVTGNFATDFQRSMTLTTVSVSTVI